MTRMQRPGRTSRILRVRDTSSALTKQRLLRSRIIAVPTAIAGIYGMNFKHMPELEWEYGCFTVIGIVLLVCTGLFWRFRRVGWL